MPCPPGHRASSLGEPASSRSRIARGPFVRRGISQGAVRQARVVSQAAHSTENDDPDPAGHHEAEDSTRLGDGRDAALLSINVIDIGRVPYQVLLWAPTEVVSIRIAFRRGKTKLRAIKPTFCPHGEPSSSISKTSSTPKMVCMCSTGLAIVAEQETNRTRRFPTAAQIRLSLGSNKALVNSPHTDSIGLRSHGAPAHHKSHVTTKQAGVDVQLVDDDEAQLTEEAPPPVFLRQDSDMKHVRIGKDLIEHPLAVTVVSASPNVYRRRTSAPGRTTLAFSRI